MQRLPAKLRFSYVTCAHVLSAQELSAILDEIQSLVAKEMRIPQLVGSGYWRRLAVALVASKLLWLCLFLCLQILSNN